MSLTCLAMGWLAVTTASVAVPPGDEERLSVDASQENIAALIRRLGDRSYDRRTTATRQLCTIGFPAVEQLRHAAKLDSTETSLRARSILSIIDELPFTGIEVRLSLSKSIITWDEPVDLLVTLMNHSKRPTKIPFDMVPNRRAALSPDAQQVGDMLDVADCVHVSRHDGETIDLAVDDISVDPAVADVVQERIDGGPMTVLQPGETHTLTVRDFNRGWARFALLETGLYTITVDYVPPWKDEVLRDQQIGHVTSRPVTIRVTDAAPASVLRSGPEASVELRREGSMLVAVATNHTDQELVVNRNYGVASPFAHAVWVCESMENRREVPVSSKPGLSWQDLAPLELIQVPPGRSLELAKTSIDELRNRLGDGAAKRPLTVQFQYTNLCNRPWQIRQGKALLGNPQAPAVLQTPLPRRMLSARHTTAPLTLPAGE